MSTANISMGLHFQWLQERQNLKIMRPDLIVELRNICLDQDIPVDVLDRAPLLGKGISLPKQSPTLFDRSERLFEDRVEGGGIVEGMAGWDSLAASGLYALVELL